MKYTSQLQKDIVDYFNAREDFHYHGYTGTFFFNTWKKGEQMYQIDAKKPHGDKDFISASILICSNKYVENEKHGIEMKIEMYMWGYQSQETVFQGWIESIDQLEIIILAVGL